MTQSNFSFLSGTWAFLADDALSAEKYALSDPRAAAIYGRRTLERGMKWIFKNDEAINDPYETSLAAMIHHKEFRSSVKQGLLRDVSFLWKLGNQAVHESSNIPLGHGIAVARALHAFLGWLTRVYTRNGTAPPPFDQNLLPKPAGHKNAEILAAVKKKVQEAQAAERKAQEEAGKRKASEEEVAALKAQLAQLQAVKQANSKKIRSDEYTEAQTRDLIIDVMLAEVGWDAKAKNVEEYEVTGMPTPSGKGKVDYVLWGDDGKPLALVEAKKTKIDPELGRRQAELYANCLEEKFGQRPIIYCSNGYKTRLWDDMFYPPRDVQGFASHDELHWKISQRKGRKPLTGIRPKAEIAGRHYQMEAISRVMESFDAQHKRKNLIVMATGTGKTRLSISIVDMLLRAGWIRKVLFLADRVSLVNQAKRNFNALLPNVSVASLLDRKDEEARVLFSTYPTMLNCIDGTGKDQKNGFGASHFDLIIIDEAHRSVYQKYGAIFDYFDSLLIGLTATPRHEVDRNTYNLFELENHQPTFSYELQQAVDDGFLVPPKALSVPLKFQREGIKYNELSKEEQEAYELEQQFYDEETGELIEQINPAALNKWLFNEDTVNKVLQHVMENGIKVEGGDKIGKTIIFAKNAEHAGFIVKQFDRNYPHLAGKFCRQIDHSVKYAQSLIDDFSIKDKNPQIAVSVDMLDTGIDVPEVVNLVFFKIVRSKTKFWQMIGRGTRLCPDLFLPGDDKTEFAIFDYCQNFEFFGENPDGYDSGLQESVKQKIFKRRLDLVASLEEQNRETELVASLKDQMHDVVRSMDPGNFIVRKERQQVETFAERKNWEILKPEDYQALSGHVSGLPSVDHDHELARRFDLLMVSLQIAVLKNSRARENYIKRVRAFASGLENKGSIPSVAAAMELIHEIQLDEWWRDVTLPLLENARVKLRELAKFVDPEKGTGHVFTNFTDELGDDVSEYNPVQSDASMSEYRKRVQRFLHENKDHLTIRRLRNNEPITRADVKALEDILFSQEGPLTREEYEAAFGGKPLGILVRSVVGLSRKAAKETFADFLTKANLSSDQMTFLDQIVDYLVRNGTMEPEIMFETPFTNLHQEGLSGIFTDGQSSNVVALVRQVNENADVSTEDKKAV